MYSQLLILSFFVLGISAQKFANTDAGFFDPFVLGFSYFNILLIMVVAISILLCVIVACCCFGSKRPPVEYRYIVGLYGDEDLSEEQSKDHSK